MSTELLVNDTPQETRVAVIENGLLQEVFVEREARRGIAGNIYVGRVSRVLPGMQAAFVDIGLEKTGFLHVSDIKPPAGLAAGGNGEAPADLISQLLHDGDRVCVQVLREPLGSKGSRLSTRLSIPSVYVVFLPDGEGVGVSRRIECPEERERLRAIVETSAGRETTPGGHILRTAAESASDEIIAGDLRFLHRLWASISEQIRARNEPGLVHQDLPLVIRTMRELIGLDIERIRIDSRLAREEVTDFASRFFPEMAPRIEYYEEERPVFDIYGVEDEIRRALERVVPLKSGGHLVIDETEAMTTIDVNTGSYVGRRSLEETSFKTNLEAARAIGRQLRLRNVGGIVIVDFIDMHDEEHRRQVQRALERSLGRDRARPKISTMSPLGLVQLTRARTRESLARTLSETCPTCDGHGHIKSVETVCYEIFREIMREARHWETGRIVVIASREVVDRLMDEESSGFADLESLLDRPIRLQAEPMYGQAQYDVILA